ncbi:unnamed protein product [Symbiodinium sp. CCMP2592]|nr:unnamed protein product [Symbiodinium sp. CCMP2592]
MESTQNTVLLVCIPILQALTAAKVLFAAGRYIRRTWDGRPLRLFRACGSWLALHLGLSSSESGRKAAEAFHAMQCQMLIYALQVIMAMALARFVFAQMYLLAGEPPPVASLDLSLVFVHFIALFLTTCPRLVTPRSLDVWYVVLQTLFALAFLNVGPRDVVTLSNWTFVLRVLLGLAVKRGWLALLGNAVCSVLVMRILGFQTESALFSAEITKLSFLLLCVFSVRQLAYRDARSGLDLKTRTIELEAVTSLLRGFCDAVVEVDNHLNIVGDSRQLSTMLLRECSTTVGCLGEKPFLELFCADDRDHLHECFSAVNHGSSHTQALNARLLDSVGSSVKVELLHIQFLTADKETHRLIGVREFQDLHDAAPDQLPVYGVPSSAADVADQKEHKEGKRDRNSGKKDSERMWLLFDVGTFGILSMDPKLEDLCKKCKGTSKELSIFDVSTDLNSAKLSQTIQDTINLHSEPDGSPASIPAVDLGAHTLLGSVQVQSTVHLEFDEFINRYVGTLFAHQSSHGRFRLTKANVDRLDDLHRKRLSDKI